MSIAIFLPEKENGVWRLRYMISQETAHGAPVQGAPMNWINDGLIQIEEIFLCKSIRWLHVLTSIVASTS